MSALSAIRGRLASLTTSEAQVARWVLTESARVPQMSMGQVAQACNVSDTTVLRFCRSVGFHGFTDLKFRLIQDMALEGGAAVSTVGRGGEHAVVREVFAQSIQALEDTLAMVDGAFDRAVELLGAARRILVIGVGTSGPAVESMFQRLFRLGLDCRAQTDSYLQLMDAALTGPGDVVVGISHSGESLDPIATLGCAKQAGASTICITGNAQSSITEHADVTLLSVSTEIRTEALASRIAQIALVDSLYMALFLRDRERAIANEQRAYHAVIPKTV